LEREHDAVFANCGHLAACSVCAARLSKVRCCVLLLLLLHARRACMR
jgi:hypothetical protein